MDTKNKNLSKTGLIIGIAGLLCGIGLLFSDNYLIGIFGGIASAGLIIKYYQDKKKS